MKVYLASKSPRRMELLCALGAEVTAIPANIDESAFSAPSPCELVHLLAEEKALSAQAPEANIPLIAADTVVDLDGRILGKPRGEADACAMLHALSGRGHLVHTGVAVRLGDRLLADTVTTRVFFRELTDEQIRAYLQTGEPFDKAGAYGIQGRGSLFVHRIEGDYFTVVGLPICRLNELLKEIGTEGLL